MVLTLGETGVWGTPYWHCIFSVNVKLLQEKITKWILLAGEPGGGGGFRVPCACLSDWL